MPLRDWGVGGGGEGVGWGRGWGDGGWARAPGSLGPFAPVRRERTHENKVLENRGAKNCNAKALQGRRGVGEAGLNTRLASEIQDNMRPTS